MPSRNELCPCGSGKKFKKCCYHKPFSFQENEDGVFERSVPMDDELAKRLKNHIESLGPDVSPDELLFGSMNFEEVEHNLVTAMRKTGVDPAIIYAFEETGMMITEDNIDMFPQTELDLWQSKIDEFRSRSSGGESDMKFPVGTIAHYGPDDKRTTKIVVGVILHETAEPILRRFVGSKVKEDPKVRSEIVAFLKSYQVKQTLMVGDNMGCPHEEGQDFPVGEDCPFCPFWAGKQGSSREPF